MADTQLHLLMEALLEKKFKLEQQLKELKALATDAFAKDPEAKAKAEAFTAFQEFDVDKSGFIDEVELAYLALLLGRPLSEDERKKTLASIDSSKDGKISFEEFYKWLSTTTAPESGVFSTAFLQAKVKLYVASKKFAGLEQASAPPKGVRVENAFRFAFGGPSADAKAANGKGTFVARARKYTDDEMKHESGTMYLSFRFDGKKEAAIREALQPILEMTPDRHTTTFLEVADDIMRVGIRHHLMEESQRSGDRERAMQALVEGMSLEGEVEAFENFKSLLDKQEPLVNLAQFKFNGTFSFYPSCALNLGEQMSYLSYDMRDIARLLISSSCVQKASSSLSLGTIQQLLRLTKPERYDEEKQKAQDPERADSLRSASRMMFLPIDKAFGGRELCRSEREMLRLFLAVASAGVVELTGVHVEIAELGFEFDANLAGWLDSESFVRVFSGPAQERE